MLDAIITGHDADGLAPPAADKPATKKSTPKGAPAEKPATAMAAGSPGDDPPGIAPGVRNPPHPEPLSRRMTAPTPRNTAAWGFAIAALLLGGVLALVWPGRAAESPSSPSSPSVRRIVLTSVPGYTVQPDRDTETRLRAELGAQRAVPRQLSAAIVRDSHGDIVAIYEAIVFKSDVAASRRDLDDFIALFAEGAGISADSFAERTLGRRTVWSGLLDQGQAILLFRGPEVVIVITAASGAEGDRLTDAILAARGL